MVYAILILCIVLINVYKRIRVSCEPLLYLHLVMLKFTGTVIQDDFFLKLSILFSSKKRAWSFTMVWSYLNDRYLKALLNLTKLYHCFWIRKVYNDDKNETTNRGVPLTLFYDAFQQTVSLNKTTEYSFVSIYTLYSFLGTLLYQYTQTFNDYASQPTYMYL